MTDVRAFVLSYVEAIGGDGRPLPTGAVAVRWPPTHVGRFGPTATLAFDPAVAEVAKAELCVVGSDMLDRIVADASARGFHCIARVDAEGDHPPEEVLAANLTFKNASANVLSAEKGVVPYVLFNYRVTLETDERAERMRSVLLNAETMQEHTVAELFLQESLTLPEEPIVAGTDLEASYAAACAALERAILPDAREVRQKAKALLDEELRRIEEFYDTSIKELYASRMHAPLEAERVYRAERDRRVEEARRKYAFAAKARLVNMRTILIPTTTMRVQVANARASKELGLEFDAVNLETSRLTCEACGAALATVYLCARGHLACDDCDRGCAFCDFVACRLCASDVILTCTTCVKPLCSDHLFADEIGRKPYCGDHIHACAICGRMVGPGYVNPCALCGQRYCAMCVEASGRCTTCRTLAAVPATHEDVARLLAAKGEPKGLSKWLRGQNGKYTVIVGKGTVFQYLYVVDTEGAVIRRQKGMGLAP